MNDLDLASLLVSRVCHDLIGPVGALINGLEVLADEDDATMREHALSLIGVSARSASAKLKFCRLAYGASGSPGSLVDPAEARDVVLGMLDGAKFVLDWQVPAENLPTDQVRLIANLTVCAIDSIPRGGKVEVKVEGTGSSLVVAITASGPMARLTPETLAALHGETAMENLDGRGIHPFFTGLIVRMLKGDISAAAEGGVIRFRANMPKIA